MLLVGLSLSCAVRGLSIGITFDVDVVCEIEWVKERGEKQMKNGKRRKSQSTKVKPKVGKT